MKSAEFRPFCEICPMCVYTASGGGLECMLHKREVGRDDRCTLNCGNIKALAWGLRYHQCWRRGDDALRQLPPYVIGVMIDAAIDRLGVGDGE